MEAVAYYAEFGEEVKLANAKINRKVNCNSFNVVYIIECTKNNCKQKYIENAEKQIRRSLWLCVKV